VSFSEIHPSGDVIIKLQLLGAELKELDEILEEAAAEEEKR
jgi:hypothetical protein